VSNIGQFKKSKSAQKSKTRKPRLNSSKKTTIFNRQLWHWSSMNQKKTGSQDQSSQAFDAFADAIFKLAETFLKSLFEVFKGISYGTIPYFRLGIMTAIFCLIIIFEFDYKVLNLLEFGYLYPKNATLYSIYKWMIVSSPWLIWGMAQIGKKKRLQKMIDDVIHFSNLKAANERHKGLDFIFDKRNPEGISFMRLKQNAIPISDLEKAKSNFEAKFQIYIDRFERRDGGNVDIYYSKHPLTSNYQYDLNQVNKPSEFLVGKTLFKTIKGDFDKTPHFLVAGQTGGGKSSFLRQLSVTLLKTDTETELTMIDLKRGAEFDIFENIPRVNVAKDMDSAILRLKQLETLLDKRLSESGHGYHRRKSYNKTNFTRHVIIVDEIAEIFVAGAEFGDQKEDIKKAKAILSKIARLGRSVNINAVLATQRPDAKALDSQIKANLSGVICYAMPNDASSKVVLDRGTATDLPLISGRAIYKNGSSYKEVQTPYLSKGCAYRELKEFYTETEEKIIAPKNDEYFESAEF
jgi:S-DNA-T family DNA segregation ATPase FtsK/SpoIIIE